MQLTDSCTPRNHPCLHNYIKSDFAYLITSHYDRQGMEDAEFSQMSEYFRHHLTMLSNGLTWKLDARVDMTSTLWNLTRLPILVWLWCRLALNWRLLTWSSLLLAVLILRINTSQCWWAHGASSFSADKHWLATFFRLPCANTPLMTPTDHAIGVKWAAGSTSNQCLARGPSDVQNTMSTYTCISFKHLCSHSAYRR